MAGISGDFKELRKFRERLGKLSKKRQGIALKRIAVAALSQVALGFRNQRDPYDNPWRKLSASTIAARRKGAKKGGPRILENNGRLKGSFKPGVKANGFTISTDVEYAAPHQDGYKVKKRKFFGKILGTTRVKPRMMVPTKRRGLGTRWNRAILDVFKQFREDIKGKRPLE